MEIKKLDLHELGQVTQHFEHRPAFSDEKFLSYHKMDDLLARLPGFSWENYAFYHKGKCVAYLVGHRSGDVFRSSSVGSFGGLVFNELDHEELTEVVRVLIEEWKKMGITHAQIVLPPIFYFQSEKDYFNHEHVLLQQGFLLIDSFLNHHLVVKGEFDNVLLKDTRKEFNRSKNHHIPVIHTLKDREEIIAFHACLVEDRKKFKAMPTHSLDDLLYLYDHQRERINLHYMKLGDSWACGFFTLQVTPSCVYLFYPMILEEYRSANYSYSLYEAVFNTCKAMGVRFLDLGPSSFGLTPNKSLIKFKESLGGVSSAKKVFEWRNS